MKPVNEDEIRDIAKTCSDYYADFGDFLVVKAKRFGIADQIKSFVDQSNKPTSGQVIEYVMSITK